jgi:lipopolysaccharide export system protein LptA
MRYLAISLLLVLITCPSGLAQKPPEDLFSGDAPVEIRANTLRSDQKKGITVFEGSVVATQGDTTLRADRMEVYTDDKGTIARIVATGNVLLQKDNQKISAQQAEYIHKEGMIIFTGRPVATSEGTTVMGKRIIYHTSDGSTTVEQSYVIIEKRTESGKP